jgi:hypothetical protein
VVQEGVVLVVSLDYANHRPVSLPSYRTGVWQGQDRQLFVIFLPSLSAEEQNVS